MLPPMDWHLYWQRHLRLHRLENLRHWLAHTDLCALYGHGFGKVESLSCQLVQEQEDESRIILYADGQPLITLVCYHRHQRYDIETVVRILRLEDGGITPECYLMLVLFLLDEFNGKYPWGYLVNRMEGTHGDICLCWRQELPKLALRSQVQFDNFLRNELGTFLFQVLAPEIEQSFAEFLSILRRTSEFDVSTSEANEAPEDEQEDE